MIDTLNSKWSRYMKVTMEVLIYVIASGTALIRTEIE